VILSGWGKAATAASRSDRPALATEGSLKTPISRPGAAEQVALNLRPADRLQPFQLLLCFHAAAVDVIQPATAFASGAVGNLLDKRTADLDLVE
jgi:hypothetical protein